MSPLSDSKHRIVALALIFFSGGSLLCAQEQSATAISQHVKDIFARAAKAVVKIHGADEHSEICGTGFFIDDSRAPESADATRRSWSAALEHERGSRWHRG